MNKKGIDVPLYVVITLVLAGLALFLVFIAAPQYLKLTKEQSAKSSIQLWVKQRALSEGTVGADRPPIPELADPYIIEKESDLVTRGDKPAKAFEEIANSMYDCWDAFDRGKTDFLDNIHRNTFCYSCRVIKFSKDVRNEFPQVYGFNRYLNEYKPLPGENKPTYLQFLANDNEYALDEEDLRDDILETNKDLFVIFFAASGRTAGDIALTLFGLDGLLEEDLKPENYVPASSSSTTPVAIQTEEDVEALRQFGLGVGLGGGHLGSKGYLLYKKYFPGRYAAKKTGEVLAKELGTGALKAAEIEVAENGAKQLSFSFVEETTEKKGIKALSKSFSKKMFGLGVKALASKLTLYVSVVEAGYGSYKIIWGDKPFIAAVMLTGPSPILEKCNEEKTEA